MTDMTGVMSVIIRMMWHVIGMTWLTKKVMSDSIATLTEPDRSAKNPTIAPG